MTTESLSHPQSPSQRQLWLAAIKPPMYSVAAIPISLGTAIAWAETAQIDWRIFLTFLSAGILIVAWSNLSNDVFDAETGIDINKPHSLVNLTGNKTLIFRLSNLCLGLGICGILMIAWWQQDVTVLGIIGLCCLLGYVYQGPPFRWGYQGWGEILCFLAYGPLTLSAVYYSQTQTWSVTNLAASVILGLTTSVILFCSHFHQVEDDIAAGKRSPIVRMGTARGAQLLPMLCGAVYGFLVLLWGIHIFPTWTLLALGSIPSAWKLRRFVAEYHNQPHQVSSCKFIAVAWHFWSGALLTLGFLI
ncbi:2-carboxy-1,4-naphthoquinone phytyltransferase [Synechococcales cyanobacterium C]|uniref:2-carboxy-1,4-naphthoquinone phytyltransferase n=1 Tax=Petrachloros mirabilis ULC683 TaxID=2781853 RepID=A0A8K2A1B7_9CYAN|nr:2-carboxy-1,4-naphthoquinone phytyltransferase [Petrachloros mirabilis]NCJ07612.1 2-carboxy-1,4-naphthoquinone phytyltransferase [Petrachloros mirabilis ULC683]